MRSRPAPLPALLAALSAVLLAGACLPVRQQQQAGPGRSVTPAASRSTDQGPEGTDTPEEFARDMRASQNVAERYWASRLGSGFQPVQQVIPYERDGEVSCGGQPLPRNNAVYCSAGDFIAYDVNWAFAAFQQIGDSFVYYLLGHEYAHGIQARLGIRKEFTIEQELQADCMAGAFIGDQARDGALRMDDGDTQELADGLVAVGDDPGQPWFAPGAHGSPAQRFQAFADGYEQSLTPCGL
ncbi:neutral zinc metallopeptidase [Actinoplanes sp. NEAU-A12]|uniref:Neutral zinc metallopeptidase n=1 Tax=Actinoplanes sandaracinus TaxID=3045177 RepID=A0ABT6WK93_9ACTN|nr:neutral zinc metallopeptidase [Actinoplanes sandaracinus]MDI6100144.1 neutral zinc metallopeptidase [Actinoplanes sandaracinus]